MTFRVVSLPIPNFDPSSANVIDGKDSRIARIFSAISGVTLRVALALPFNFNPIRRDTSFAFSGFSFRHFSASPFRWDASVGRLFNCCSVRVAQRTFPGS
jgi:hypothetical protein